MAVSVTVNTQKFSGNGVTTSFPFTFRTHSSEDIKAYVISSSGVLTTLTKDLDYSVSLNMDGTGSVSYPISGSALASGAFLRVVREVSHDQGVDLTVGGAYSPQSVEDALDDLVFQIQQVSEQLGRTIKAPQGEDAIAELPDVSSRAGKYYGFDANGAPTTLAGSGTATDAALVTFSPNWTGGADRTTEAKLSDIVHIEDFGATASDDDADAATNVTAFENAFASGAGTIVLGEGVYRVNDTLTPLIYQRVIGQGKTISAVKMIDSVTGQPVWGIESHHIQLCHFQTGWVSATQTTAGSVGIRFMDTAAGINALCGWGVFHDLRIENTYSGIDVDKSGTMAGCFSWTFRDLYIREFEESAIYNHPTGAGNSGDVYQNLYLANARAGTQETGTMLDIRETANVTMNLVNLEANRMDATKPLLYLQNIAGFSINSLHIEDVDMDNHTGSDNGIIEMSDACIGVINGLRVDGVTIPATADRLALFKIKCTNSASAYQPRVAVNGISIIDTTGIVPATAWNLVQTNGTLSSANGARLTVTNLYTAKAFDGTVNNGDADFLRYYTSDATDDLIVNNLRADTQVELGSGGPIFKTGTGTPESAVTAPQGSVFLRTDGGSNTTLYSKESGSGNTGWLPVITDVSGQITQHGTTYTDYNAAGPIEWTSIPSGTLMVVLSYAHFSAAAGASQDLIIELGDSTSYKTTGYTGRVREGTGGTTWSSNAQITQGLGGGEYAQGTVTMTKGDGNQWHFLGIGTTEGGTFHICSGEITLSGELTRLRADTSAGTNIDGSTGCNFSIIYQ